MKIDLSEYTEAAGRYRPEKIRVLFIAESPPAFLDKAKQSYFFFESNPGQDILFATVIKALFKTKYRKKDGNKPDLLRQFQAGGFRLMDAVEYPINRVDGKKVKTSDRVLEIQANIPGLLSRLYKLRRRKILLPDSGIILIKKVVFEMLYKPLTDAGYRVLHNNKIDFPKYYFDRDTIKGIEGALKKLDQI